ncbi:MAG: RluA family pseudouridine synthase [bacterium]
MHDFNDDPSQRLDLKLLLDNSDLSRTFIAKAIKAGLVEVNGKVILKPSFKIYNSDIINFKENEAITLIQEKSADNVIPVKMDLNVIFEDEELLIINKTSGMPTHPSHGHITTTLLNGVHEYLHEEASSLKNRKHMVHRLDKDTSGLIIFAKNEKMLWWLHRQFAERKIEKSYYALGFASKKYNAGTEFKVEGYIERSRREKKLYLFSNKYGRWTHTDFEILKSYSIDSGNVKQYLSLFKCSPKTGRTHQIRVHLKQINFPIWGDVLYSSDKQKRFVSNYSSSNNIRDRLFLHAYSLKFVSYSGKNYNIEIPLTEELQNILNSFNEEK